MFQRLVSAGHSWSSIKEYTLSEIGEFLLAISKEEKRRKADQLSTHWMGTNLTKNGLEDTLRDMGFRVSRPAEAVSPKQAQENWKKLASFMKNINAKG